MRIGIITIVKVNNYGAELQAFATQKKMEMMGYDVEVIDYLYYKDWHFNDTAMAQPFVKMNGKDKLMYFFKYRIAAFLVDKVMPLINDNVKKRMVNFRDFHRKNTKFSRCFKSMDDLYREHLDYDVYVVGSDQVWNPGASSSIEPYFLTFAPQGARTFSYASSFGVDKIGSSIMPKMKEWMSCIKAISVRETSGVELVKRITGCDATLVCDPTLLLDKEDWKPYMKVVLNMPQRYVIIYQLSASQTIVDLACRIAQEQNIPVYRICKRAFWVEQNEGVKNILDAGPAEFLSLIANASCVVTDSFHGTAFSVNFNIPFYTVVSVKKKNNSRMESLLRYVGLMDRMVRDNVGVKCFSLTTYDKNKVNNRLLELRKLSVDFINNSINC